MAELRLSGEPRVEGPDTFSVEADDHHRRVTSHTYAFYVEAGTTLKGRVGDGYTPIPGATVELYSNDDTSPTASLVTDSTGSFSFEHLTDHRRWYLHATDPTGTHLDHWSQGDGARTEWNGIQLRRR